MEATAPARAPQAMAPTPVQPMPTARPTVAPAISALCCSAQLAACLKPWLALFHAWFHQGPDPPALPLGGAPWLPVFPALPALPLPVGMLEVPSLLVTSKLPGSNR